MIPEGLQTKSGVLDVARVGNVALLRRDSDGCVHLTLGSDETRGVWLSPRQAAQLAHALSTATVRQA